MAKHARSRRTRGRPCSASEEPCWSPYLNTWILTQLIKWRENRGGN